MLARIRLSAPTLREVIVTARPRRSRPDQNERLGGAWAPAFPSAGGRVEPPTVSAPLVRANRA